MRFDAALFDLDGTLLDTLADLAAATNAALERHGFPPHPTAAYRRIVGDGQVNQILRALPASDRDEATVARVLAAAREEYARRWADHTRLYGGVAAMLNELAARGVRMAVLSNKPHAMTLQAADRFLAAWPMEVVLGARDGVPLKPDPSAALEVAARMGLAPARFLYVGDTNTDMQTARAAGMHAVGALWGFRDEAELRAAGATELIDRPARLLDLL